MAEICQLFFLFLLAITSFVWLEYHDKIIASYNVAHQCIMTPLSFFVDYEKVGPRVQRDRSYRPDITGIRRKDLHFTHHSEENPHRYPKITGDICTLNITRYEEEYQDAIDRDMNYRTRNLPWETKATWPLYHSEFLDRELAINLFLLREEQSQCP